MFGKQFSRALAVATVGSLIMASTALASDVNVTSVVDVNAPTGSVTLTPGGAAGDITIHLSVTGNQAGTATFEVYRDWTLSGGVFTGSNPKEFTVAPQSGGTTTLFDTPGTVSVAAGHASGGPHILTVSVFDITNSNETGAKLEARNSATYSVTVGEAPPSCTTPAQPTITATGGTLGAEGSGWYTAAPTLSSTSAGVQWATAVNGGIKSSFSSTVPVLGTGTTIVYAKAVSGSCQSTEVSSTFKVDPNAPSIADNGPTTSPNAAGWYKTDVTNTFTASDGLNESGIPSSFTNPFTKTTSGEGTAVKVNSGAVSDVAGNSNAGRDSAPFKIDKTAPTSVVTGFAGGTQYTLGDTLPTVTCSDDDNLSGVATAGTLSGPSGANNGTVGTFTYSCNGAVDNAGNVQTVADLKSYSVIFNWNGFFAPVENLNAWNSAKAGQSIPVKFSLDGDQGLNIFATDAPYNGAPRIVQIACPSSGTPDPIEEYATATANSKLIYDSLADQYNYVWKTDKLWAGKCFRLDVKLIDGTTHSANFKFTK